jgi:hypothetical protein
MPPVPSHLPVVASALLVATLFAVAPVSAGSRITTDKGRSPNPAWADSFGPHHLPDPGVAQRLSAGRTALPFAVGTVAFALDVGVIRSGYIALGGYAVAAAGIVIGPCAGYTYGGIPGRGAVGMGVRLALVVAAPVAVALYDGQDDWSDEDESAAIALGLLAGTGLAALSGVWDITTVPNNVERNNSRLLQQARVRVEPAVTPFAHAPGIAIRVGFGSGGS